MVSPAAVADGVHPPLPAPDSRYANLYDRRCALRHDMAVREYLAFAAAVRYRALAWAPVWQQEAAGEPDASKA